MFAAATLATLPWQTSLATCWTNASSGDWWHDNQLNYWLDSGETLLDGFVFSTDGTGAREGPTFARGYLQLCVTSEKKQMDLPNPEPDKPDFIWRERINRVTVIFGPDMDCSGDRDGEPGLCDYETGASGLHGDDMIVITHWTREHFDSLMASLPGWA